jgi:2-polyprenyl-6-methoxyphenol hydroxylase-like FAD-dependent oxidoreductase
MRVAVVGCGIAGPAAALLLARDGHEVTIVERVADPQPVGAGILIQPLGQRILDELGLLDALAARSTAVRRFDGRTRTGRRVLDFGYEDAQAGRGSVGLGVHRAELFTILMAAVRAAAIPVLTGVEVRAIDPGEAGWSLEGGESATGPFDLVVVADGARSRLRASLGVASKDVGYPYGAIWAVVPDPDGLAGDVLTQRYDGTRTVLGILPTGVGLVSIFWSIPTRDIDAAIAAGPEAWVATAREHAGDLAPLVDRAVATGILGARYRDVVVPDPVVTRGRHGIVLLGDAAHAMSPQLGMGASLALADAWALAGALRASPDDLGGGLRAYAADRRAHIRWYTWLSRIMTPVFQSGLSPIGWPRDLLFGPISRVPWVRRQFVDIQLGRQTSPWTTWPPLADGGALSGGRD